MVSHTVEGFSTEGDPVRARIGRYTMVAATALVGGMLLAGTASAQTGDGPAPEERIVLSGRLVVEEDETVDTAVIFHGPARIDGTVLNAVVVFDGSAVISGTVEGDVVVFNGPVRVRSGALIGGDLVSVETPVVEEGATIRGQQQGVDARFDAGDFGFAGRLAWWIGYSASTLVLGMGLLLLAGAGRRHRPGRPGAHGRRDRPGRSGLLPAAGRRGAVPRDRGRDPPRLVPAARARPAVHDRIRGGCPRLGTPARRAAEVSVPGVPRGVGDPARARAHPLHRRATWILASIFGLGLLWVAARGSVRAQPPASPETPPMPAPLPS